jgi:hypothetical protein
MTIRKDLISVKRKLFLEYFKLERYPIITLILWGGSVSTVTRLHGGGWYIFFFLLHPDQLWGPLRLLSSGKVARV